MKVVVQRVTETDKSIIGTLDVDGQFECYTLEPARVNPVLEGHPAIPAGEYDLELTLSPHFHIITPEVMNVPGRTDIRIHPGNFPKDTKGCTLVGETRLQNTLGPSRPAFAKLMTLLRTSLDPIRITYIDPVP